MHVIVTVVTLTNDATHTTETRCGQAQADKSFHACVDDVGYILVARYTPVRADGVAGQPVEAESPVVQVRVFPIGSVRVHRRLVDCSHGCCQPRMECALSQIGRAHV